MLIIIAGFAGSGKSTLSELLGHKFSLNVVHASHLLKELQTKSVNELDIKNTQAGSGFWESKEGQEFLKKREQDFSMDKALDKKLLEIAEKGNVILDSWTMPWLSKKGFKIWLNVSQQVRAKRVAERDKLPEKEVLEKIKERDKKTADIYKKIYGFEIGKDFTPFNLVIDASDLNEKQVFDLAVKKILESAKK